MIRTSFNQPFAGLVAPGNSNGLHPRFFLTTHLIQEAEDLCDRVAIIGKGEIGIIDTPEALKERVKETEMLEIRPNPVSQALPGKMEALPGVEKATLVESKLRRCEKIPFLPPPCPSPVEGEGISSCISIYLPSPLAGEGRVRGRIPIFSHLLRLYGKSLHLSICQIVTQLNAEGVSIVFIQTLSPTLEDAFVKLTGVDAEVMRVDKPVKMGGPG